MNFAVGIEFWCGYYKIEEEFSKTTFFIKKPFRKIRGEKISMRSCLNGEFKLAIHVNFPYLLQNKNRPF